MQHTPPRPSDHLAAATARRLLVGAGLAAILGTTAGAALRPAAAERGAPPTPQLIEVAAHELAALEAGGRGWPAREPG